jgi:radical SAM/Cys-rich protein
MSEALPCFADELRRRGHATPRRDQVTTLQLNIGLRCNLACRHCHVESGPLREEAMHAAGISRVLELLEHSASLETLDITGGAPELSPHFRRLVSGARGLGKRVIDRCNLTVLLEPGQEDTAEFLAREGVHLVASLPCYAPENVEHQRGRGVYRRSIRALSQLNELGYGMGDARQRLDMVYNTVGATLPPPQSALEARYRAELHERFGIQFDSLLSITNMPIKRFGRELERDGNSGSYLSLLVDHFNPDTLASLMCRSTLSVAWDGSLYDCDFNQALGIPLVRAPRTIWDLDDVAALKDRRIATAPHCFGCTAGAGSSCGGALTTAETT